jgi:hypothetical protein
MRYSIAAIETKYRGVLFRSRLEAKWAAFFDILKWKWQYEPCDLPKWSPDFFVCAKKRLRDGELRRIPFLAEIKPYSRCSQFDDHVFMQYTTGHPLFKCEACVGLGIDPSVSAIELESDGAGSFGPVPFSYLVSRDCSDRDLVKMWRKACNKVQWRFDSNGKRV